MVRAAVLVRFTSVTPSGPDRGQLAWLPAEERARAARHRHEADARRSLTGAVAARVLLADTARIDPATVRLERDPHGRPVVEHPDGWHVSVSHAGGLVVCAAATRPVGVDLEAPPAPPFDPALAARICTPAEVDELERLRPEAQPDALVRAWVRKEAVAKALGRGLGQPFDLLDVRRDAVAVPGEHGRWTVRDLSPARATGAEPIAAVAAPGRWWRVVLTGC